MTGAEFYEDRVNRGWSQQRMADEIDVSVDVIRSIEAGRRPMPGNAIKVAEFYKSTILELWPEARAAAV